jgi:hypothetical protein
VIVHATAADLAAWTGEAAPAGADRLLRSASLLVDRELLTAVYATDADGRAVDLRVLVALRDATCAQAATWAALGIDPVKGPADPGTAPVLRKSLGSGTVEYERTGQAAARQQAATGLAPEAAQILAAAGLLSPAVIPYG